MKASEEIAFLFLVASVTAAFVSVFVNRFIKTFPVLATQISMLITLLLYPGINGYLFILSSSDYDDVLYGNMNHLSYNSVMFFAPLPVCILVSVAFSFLRKNKDKKAADIEAPAHCFIKSKILKNAALVVSVIMGGLCFLSVAGKMAVSSGKERLIVLMAFTVYGIVASLAAWVVFGLQKMFFDE